MKRGNQGKQLGKGNAVGFGHRNGFKVIIKPRSRAVGKRKRRR